MVRDVVELSGHCGRDPKSETFTSLTSNLYTSVSGLTVFSNSVLDSGPDGHDTPGPQGRGIPGLPRSLVPRGGDDPVPGACPVSL